MPQTKEGLPAGVVAASSLVSSAPLSDLVRVRVSVRVRVRVGVRVRVRVRAGVSVGVGVRASIAQRPAEDIEILREVLGVGRLG